jgi:sugar phosphate isomerase/epimerase
MRLGIEAGEHTLALAEELGIGGAVIDGAALVERGPDAALGPLRQRRLAVCQIGAFGFNPLSSDAGASGRQGDLLRKIIPLAPQTGCGYVVIGPGNYHPSGFGHFDPRNFTAAAIDELAEGLKPFIELAERHGVCLSIEPYLKGVVHSPARFRALHARVGSDALRANVDPSSLYSFWEALRPDETVESVCTQLAGHYGLVHVKEVGIDEGFHVHMGLKPLGDGNTNWAQLLRLVEPHLPEDSWVIMEHVASAEEGRQSYRRLQAAAGEAGVSLA